MALDIIDELLAVAAALTEAGIEHAVCGGLALAIHGHPRMTDDLDLLVRESDVARALEVVRGLGFDIPARVMTFGRRTGVVRTMNRVSKLDPATGALLPLDLLHAVGVYEPVWASRVRYRLGDREIVVVSREGLATMKQIAGRPQDLVDLARLEGRATDEPDADDDADP